MKRGATIGNVIEIKRPQQWYESMTYGELLEERRFIRSEKKRLNTALTYAHKIDPRGMWVERFDVWKNLEDMVECCDYAIQVLEKEMIKRSNPSEGR